MGVCYKLILQDEFDWDYVGQNKEERLLDFETQFPGHYIERIAEWYGFVVYDIEKNTPYTDKRKDFIRGYADRAYYIDDLGSGIIEIDLPRRTTAQQAYYDDLENRRTPEEKKASEDHIRLKLEKMASSI